MAHVHDVEVVDRDGTGIAAGLLLGVFALIVIAAIAFGVLWTRPWDSSTSHSTQPGISDNGGGGGQSGGGQSGGSQQAP